MEGVVFEGEEKKKKLGAVTTDSRKRKRGDGKGATEAEVKTWDREMRQSGGTAVVVFVDKASCEMGLKAAAKAVKSKKKDGKGDGVIVWGEGVREEYKVPALGISRMMPIRFSVRSIGLVLIIFLSGAFRLLNAS